MGTPLRARAWWAPGTQWRSREIKEETFLVVVTVLSRDVGAESRETSWRR
jgi:hypothetical protein